MCSEFACLLSKMLCHVCNQKWCKLFQRKAIAIDNREAKLDFSYLIRKSMRDFELRSEIKRKISTLVMLLAKYHSSYAFKTKIIWRKEK